MVDVYNGQEPFTYLWWKEEYQFGQPTGNIDTLYHWTGDVGYYQAQQMEVFKLVVEVTDSLNRMASDDMMVTADYYEQMGGSLLAENAGSIPDEFSLGQNYPNPFNPATTIAYALPEAAQVSIDVYNILGRRVVRLMDGDQPPGSYNVQFDGRNQASGTYLVRMQAVGRSGEHFQHERMMLMIK
ncbi:MAG: T9SS type A sorting domain-containing protein [Balneolaceae bacterium]